MAEHKAEEVKEKPDAVQRCFNWIWSDLVDRSGFDDVAGNMLQDDRDELSALWKQYIADAINTETADLQRMLREARAEVWEEAAAYCRNSRPESQAAYLVFESKAKSLRARGGEGGEVVVERGRLG